MDGAIGGIVQPAPFFDGSVGGILPRDKGEDGTDLAVFFHNMALAFLDVFLQEGDGGPAVSPLGGIAVLAHLGSGICVYLQDLFQIIRFRGSDGHMGYPFCFFFFGSPPGARWQKRGSGCFPIGYHKRKGFASWKRERTGE